MSSLNLLSITLDVLLHRDSFPINQLYICVNMSHSKHTTIYYMSTIAISNYRTCRKVYEFKEKKVSRIE